jgi:tryptophan-rich sensory protein
VVWSPKHRAAALAISSAALLASTGSAMAATPTVESWTVHVERPFVDCPGFSVVGVWDITHKLTLYPDEPATVRTF